MILEILRDSWKFALGNWRFLLVAGGFLTLTADFLEKTIDPSSASWPMLLVGGALTFIIATLGTGVAAWAVDMDKRGDKVSLRNCLQSLTSWLPTVLGATLLSGVIIVLGLLVFIVPGILAGIALFLVPQVAIVERPDSVLLVLKRSRQLTKGYFWSIVVLLLIVTVPFAAIGYPISTILHDNWISFVLRLPITIASTVAESVVTAFLYFKLAACEVSDQQANLELA